MLESFPPFAKKKFHHCTMRFLGFEITRRKGGEDVEQRSQTLDLKNPSTWGVNLLTSGVSVTDRTALGLSAMWQGIRIISESIASLPLNVYDKMEDGNLTKNLNHKVDFLISSEPSHLYTSYKFRETMQAIALLGGNSYALIIRNDIGDPVALKILARTSVTPYFINTGTQKELWYHVTDLNSPVSDANMIRISGPSILQLCYDEPGILGERLTSIGKESISLGIASQRHENNFFSNGAQIPGTLNTNLELSTKQRDDVREGWNKKYGGMGATHSGETPFLTHGVTYNPLALSPKESMLIESRKFSIEEISRWLNVPLHKLSHLDRATFNNIEVLERAFVNQSLRPWAEQWESELDRKLFSRSEKLKHCTRFDFSELLRGDMKTLSEAISKLFDKGVLSIDDSRKMLGLNTKNTDWSQKHWVQLNMAGADEEREVKPTPAKEKNSDPLNGVKLELNGTTTN